MIIFSVVMKSVFKELFRIVKNSQGVLGALGCDGGGVNPVREGEKGVCG